MKFRIDVVEFHPESCMAKFPWMAVIFKGWRWLSKRVWRDPEIKHVTGEHRCLLDDDDDDDDGANKTFVTI